jgi:hypothetical protein
MCRNIRTLYNFDPPATEDEIRASALQFVRKLSGFSKPSKANEDPFARAVDEVADAARRLLDALVTQAPPTRSRPPGQARSRRAMRLPDEIPRELRQNALLLPGLVDGQGAWSKDQALEVIESLEGTTVAISDVTPYHRVAWGTELHWATSETVWSVHRLNRESDIDYARRSRRAAAAFIQECEDGGEDLLFSLPVWKDAA